MLRSPGRAFLRNLYFCKRACARVDDLAALRVFENPRPKSGHKYGAIKTLLQRAVPEVGIARLIEAAPWEEENKVKWRAQLVKIAKVTHSCPFCETDGAEADCPVGRYMGSAEARMTPMEVDLLG